MRTHQKCSAEPEALLAGGSRTCKYQRKAASGESPERWSLHAVMSSFTIKAKQRSIPKHANTGRTHMPADKIKNPEALRSVRGFDDRRKSRGRAGCESENNPGTTPPAAKTVQLQSTESCERQRVTSEGRPAGWRGSAPLCLCVTACDVFIHPTMVN